jgi:hypothetical protein
MKLLLENWREYLNEAHPYQIYCDMDGVLVDFVKGAVIYITNKLQSGEAESLREELGRDYVTEEDIQNSRLVNNYMFRKLQNHADFFENLSWMPDGRELWGYLAQHDPYILTAPLGYGSEIGKQAWIDNNLDPPPSKVVMNRHKYKWATTNEKPNILIDDREKNTIPWEEKGGIAILHTSISKTIQELGEILYEITI